MLKTSSDDALMASAWRVPEANTGLVERMFAVKGWKEPAEVSMSSRYSRASIGMSIVVAWRSTS